MDLVDRVVHVYSQNISTLAARADNSAAAISEGEAFRRPQGAFPIGLVGELDLTVIFVPAQAKDTLSERDLSRGCKRSPRRSGIRCWGSTHTAWARSHPENLTGLLRGSGLPGLDRKPTDRPQPHQQISAP